MGENRPQWDSNFGFLMAMIGSAVGLGNIWRFPYILYTNGQGTFMIPYIIALLVLGLGFMLLEYAVGVKFKASLLSTFKKIKDKLQIFGWALTMIIFLITTYYVCVIGWDLIYFVLSFFKGWGSDPNTFFAVNLLQANPSLSGLFVILPVVLISIIIVWAIIWLISHKELNSGVSAFSKFAVPALFVLIIGIVFYSLSLPGASIGYTKMFSPDWASLANPNIWVSAFGQIVFSLSLGMAIVLTYASYLPEGTNLTKNAVTVMVSNSGFEVFNAIGIFSILGFMSLSTGLPFDKLIAQGAGLAFVAYPQVLNIMGPVAYVLGPIFFLCIFIAGLTSAISLVEALSASVVEQFNVSRKKSASILCGVGFLVSIIFATAAGSDILTAFDRFLNNFALLFAIIIECIIFTWVFSVDDLMEVLNRNTLFHVGNWWKYLIKYILPILLVVLWGWGVLDTITYSDPFNLTIYGVLAAILLIVPFILYYAQKKVRA